MTSEEPEVSRARRPQGRPCDPRLDHAILTAAAEELARVGYSAMTMAAVARRAGASTASLYRRWPSKQALVGAAATQLATETLGEVDTGSLREDLEEILARKMDAAGGSRGVALLSLLGQCAHDPDMADIVQTQVFDATRHHVAQALRRSRDRGELPRGIDAGLLGTLLIGVVVDGLVEGAFATGDHGSDGWGLQGADPRPRALAALDIVLRGCGVAQE